ncbi:MAG: carotenoid oxygenase family protein [Leptolyngbyaceae cyanobacterium CAN_BIN12]|nr:carotenoid oxygenase family protein [Leptolyngbyaceae cyanobacterium CAN_BIN12]
MTTTLRPVQTPTWATAVLQPAQPFAPTSLTVLSGAIPAGLRGSLYRNGSATLERGGQRMGHWFDGDGGILGVHFTDAGATGVYRYVQTAGYQLEEKAGKLILASYGMVPAGPLWQRFNKDVKNTANTSVIALPDKLLALWEGGEPHALTLDTLETIGLDDLGGLAQHPYSAHPKRDPKTGAIFNFGVSTGAKSFLHVYCSDATGKIQRQNAILLNGLPMIHDFAIAGKYLVFCIPPVRLNVLPLIARIKSYSEALLWQPDKGTEILVVDQETLEVVSRTTTEPWYQWHFGNGYELPDGSITIEICRYKDFQTNQRLKEISTGSIQTAAVATLWHLWLDPLSGRVLDNQQVLDRSCEFPVTQPQDVGQPSRYTYLSVHRQATDVQTEVYDAIACFDHQTGTLTEANLGDQRYPMEPIYAPDAQNSEQGWILTVVYDGAMNASEVWIFDAARLDDEPVCCLALPAIVPLGFHGTWKPAD